MSWTFLIVFNIYLNVNCLLLNPQKPCVPTTSVKGPCHLCVCDTHGVFMCHATKCDNKTNVNPRISTRDECQSKMTYRYEELFCICNYNNKWMSYNCRETFQYLKPNKTLVKHSITSNISCTPKSLFLIDCNICICESSGFIKPPSCTNRPCVKGNKAQHCKFGDFLRMKQEICLCSDIGYYIDRLCVKVQDEIVQEMKEKDVAQITNIQNPRKAINTETCIPAKEYEVDCNHCICDEKTKKLVCTDNACDERLFLNSGEQRQDFLDLPHIESENESCTPEKKYRIKCNTCICTKNGKLSCTTMVCLEEIVVDETTVATSILLDIH